MLIVPHECPDVPAMREMPVIMYNEDRFRNPEFRPDVVVGIDNEVEIKMQIAHINVSQVYEWLPYTDGEIVPEGEALGHEWVDGNCVTPKTCSVCNAADGTAPGHSYDNKGICITCATENPQLTELKERLTIYGTFFTMNSADGVQLYLTWENESEKEIKYITFAVQLYNKVDDPIVCDIRDNLVEYVQQTGPIPQGKGMYTTANTTSTGYGTIFKKEHVTFDEFKEDRANGWAEQRWENIWYNSQAHYVKIVGVSIEYMDGTEYSCMDQSVIDCLGILNLNRNQYHNDYA